jgi:hypothetical protein
MKLHYILVFLLFFTLTLSAQEGGTTIPSIAIPRANTPKPETINNNPSAEYSISKPFQPTMFRVPSKTYDAPKLNKPNQFNAAVSDLDPGLQFEKKLNSNGKESSKVYRGNQFLGEFKTKSGSARIVYRDHEFVDGDMIRIWVNDKIAVYELYLQGEFQGLDLTLVPGFNKVEFEALNQGTSGPNTAEFHVYDDKGALISANQWNLATGFKATVIITKE